MSNVSLPHAHVQSSSTPQKDLDICEVTPEVMDKMKKFRFRRKENPAALVCMCVRVRLKILPACR